MAPIPKSSGVPGKWFHDLCGCCDDVPMFFKAYFCPCLVFGKIAEKTGENCVKCGIFLLIPILGIVSMVKIRGKVREMKGIEGETCDDFLTIACCPLCALIQTGNEVLLEETPDAPGGEAMARE